MHQADVIRTASIFLGLFALSQPTQGDASATEVRVAKTHPGDELRRRLGLSLPRSSELVIVYGVAQHHTRTEWSVVGWREPDGTWSVERAGEEGSGLLKIETHALAKSNKTLSPEQAAELEALLKSPDIGSEMPPKDVPSVGGYMSRMEIVTPGRTREVGWSGRLEGKLGRIADIIIGSP